MSALELDIRFGYKFGGSSMYTLPEFRAVHDAVYESNNSNINESFLTELEALVDVKIREIKIGKAGPNGSQRFLLGRAVFNWIKMLSWVAQKNVGLSRQKYPFNTDDFKAAEAGGLYLNSILSLCKNLLDYADDFGLIVLGNRINAFSWWRGICVDLEKCLLRSCLHFPEERTPPLTIAPFKGLSSKAKIDKGVREELATLNKGINPYLDSANFPSFYQLISLCVDFEKNSNLIKSNAAKEKFKLAWSEYKDEYRKFGEKIRESPDISILQGKYEKVYKQLKRKPGQPAVKVIYPEPTPPFFKIARSKRIPPET